MSITREADGKSEKRRAEVEELLRAAGGPTAFLDACETLLARLQATAADKAERQAVRQAVRSR